MSKRSRKNRRPAGKGRSEAAAQVATVPDNPGWILTSLWALAGILVYWSFGFSIAWGSDLWWHLAAGRWMWTTRSLPHVDPFSFTRFGSPWLHHEWLSDIVFHLWASLFGMRSLVYWKWGLIAATFLLLQLTLQRLTRSPLASFLGSAWAAAVASPFLDLRPHLYSLLGVVVLLSLALAPRKISWGLPALFLVWANLHGGFFLGLLVVWLILLVRELAPDGELHESRIRRVALAALCTAAAAVNINGFEAFAYPLRYAFDTKSPFRQIGEWRPPFEAGGTHSPLYAWTIALFVLSAAGLFLSGAWRRNRRLFLAALAIGMLTLAMSLRSRRFIPFFGIAAGALLAPAVAALLRPPRRRLFAAALPMAGALFGVLRLSRYPLGPRAFHTLTIEESFPVDTADFLEANRLSGNVLALYNWGGYIELRSRARLRLFIDGRADTVYDEPTYQAYLSIAGREPGWEETVSRSGASFVLWPRDDRAVWGALVRSGLWRLVYEDSVSKLLARSDPPLPDRLQAPPDSAYHRFSLAMIARARGDLGETESQLREALARMPEMNAPCHFLARILALRGDLRAAVATENACQRSFPQPLRKKEFDEFLGRFDASPQPR